MGLVKYVALVIPTLKSYVYIRVILVQKGQLCPQFVGQKSELFWEIAKKRFGSKRFSFQILDYRNLFSVSAICPQQIAPLAIL